MQAGEKPAGSEEDRDELVIAEVTRGLHRSELFVDHIGDVGAQRGERGPQPADAPCGPEAAGGRARVEPFQESASTRSVRPEEREVDRGGAVDGDDELGGRQGLLGARPREPERLAKPGAKRFEPEVLFEGRKRLGERLGDRTGPEDRTSGVGDGRDGAGLQQDGSECPVEGPLKILRASVDPRGAASEAGELPQLREGRVRSVRSGPHFTKSPSLVEDRCPPVDFATDESGGCSRGGGDQEPVVAAGHRVSAEEHPTPVGLEHRLDEDRHRSGDETVGGRPVGRLADGADGVEERIPGDIEHRVEHAGHRRCRSVLTG